MTKTENKSVIDTTLEEYANNIIIEMNKQGMKCKTEDFRSQYYDEICKAIKSNINISQRVYDSVPDLHFWIYKHYEMLGYKIVEYDWQVKSGYFEIINIMVA